MFTGTVVLYHSGLLRFFEVPYDLFGVVCIPLVPGSSHLPFHDKVSFIPKFLYRFLLQLFLGEKNGLLYSPSLCKYLRDERCIPTVILGVNADNAQNISHPKELLLSTSTSLRIARSLGMTMCLSDSPQWCYRNIHDDDFTTM